MPQRFETAVAYMAVLQMGAVAMPLSQLFGPEALEFRLQDSEAVVAIGDAPARWQCLQAVRANCPVLRKVLGVGDWRPRSSAGRCRLTPLALAQPAHSSRRWPRWPRGRRC